MVGIVILRTRTVEKNCIPKTAEEILLPGFKMVFDKNSTQSTLQLPGLCVEKRQMPYYSLASHRVTVDTFDVHITRIKSLSSFHHCSDGLSSKQNSLSPEILWVNLCLDVTRTARPWARWPFDFISDNTGVTALPKLSQQCESYSEDLGDNIKNPLFLTRLQTTGTCRLILQVHDYSPYNVLYLLWLFLRAVTASFSIYEPFQEAPVLVCEIYMIEFTAHESVVKLFFL